MGVGKYDPARPGGQAGVGRSSLWRQTLVRYGPTMAAVRYVAGARTRARSADPAALAPSVREDLTRLATALAAVLDVHVPDPRQRCRACTAGQFQVTWPCRTRRAVENGLRLGSGTSTQDGDPDDEPEDEATTPDAYEGFALAVLATHDILPAAGGHPAVCRACLVPPDRCAVWALAEGFLGITWTTQPTQQTGPTQQIQPAVIR